MKEWLTELCPELAEWQIDLIVDESTALLRQALEALEELQYATTDKAVAMADETINALKERLK